MARGKEDKEHFSGEEEVKEKKEICSIVEEKIHEETENDTKAADTEGDEEAEDNEKDEKMSDMEEEELEETNGDT